MRRRIGGTVILSNTTGEPFARRVAERLKVPYVETKNERFADGEPDLAVKESIRGADVFYICPFYPDPMEMYTEVDLMNSAIRYASAERITDVPTYMGFMRKDWKDVPRCPISIREVAIMMEKYADRVLTMTPHSPQLQGVFRIPTDPLEPLPLLKKYCKELGLVGRDVTVVSPDTGGAKGTERLARILGSPMGLIWKRRIEGEPEALYFIGDLRDVKDRDVLLYDDMLGTFGSMEEGADKLKSLGARSIRCFATHGLLSQKTGLTAEERVERSPVDEVVFTDTIPRSQEYLDRHPKLTQLSVADLFAEAIKRIHRNRSVSELADYEF